MKKIILYWLIGLLAYWLIPPSPAVAAGEFRADYSVEYSVAPNGTTIVTQNISLTNKLSNLYPKKYSILIDSKNLKNVIAYDRGGPIVPTINQKDGKTEILLTFNEKVVGLGKTMQFTLRYENGDIAGRNGNIWEVNIPGVADDPDIGTYTVNLSTPSTFGPNAYMVPAPGTANAWTKPQLTHGGISAAYGAKQFFTAVLSYHIENKNVTPATSTIAIPPDTAYQTVTLGDLTPKPDAVVTDSDGNWLAEYTLAPNTAADIIAQMTISVTLTPKDGYRQTVNPADYLKNDQYWETQDAKIISLANQYRTPREIYDYVVRTLSYDDNRVKQNPIRKGAVQALATPANSLCMEFTDLFIAIARAAGIPAREVVGYAYTNNATLRPLSFVADVLHAWPEYYDSERSIWIPVDPTWAKTTGGVNYFDKLDFNHVAFVIHGKSSTTPWPAGSYRKEGKTGKDVAVGFAQGSAPAPVPSLTTSIVFPKQVIAGLPQQGSVLVENTGQTAVSAVTVSVQSTPVDVSYANNFQTIPPYGSVRIPLNLTIPGVMTSGRGRISVRVGDATTTSTFDITPMYSLLVPIGLVAIGLIVALWLIATRPRAIWNIFKR
ncbi:transglutaminase domain-containing protein [Candidatus Gottesmanbacteria bacterium]|nr:transglutaminase domain-containing protein [Candidatus Gottesmanbacteria bacterium]